MNTDPQQDNPQQNDPQQNDADGFPATGAYPQQTGAEPWHQNALPPPDAAYPYAPAPAQGTPFFDATAQPDAYYADGAVFADPALSPAPEITPDTPFRRFWRKFGGDSFLISLGVHLVLFILAYLVIKTVISISTKREDEFVTGAGGGTGGEKVSMSEHRIKPKNAKSAVKTVPKLTVKGASSVSLPEMPKMTMALESGSPMGASSKGFGGGAGGGIGTGIGPGRGNGRNMVSLFGSTNFNTAGLIGTFYDFKQTARGVQRGKNEGRYISEVQRFFKNQWDTAFLEKSVFRAPERLVITQFLIPDMRAEKAPEAFNVKVAPSNWIAHYKGTVTAPFSGNFRFVGLADDWIVVRWRGQNALEGGNQGGLLPLNKLRSKYGTGAPPAGVGDTYPGFRPGWPLRCGPWFQVSKGTKYPIEVVIGETPGAFFCAFLAFERKDEPGKVILFRMDNKPQDPELASGKKGPIPPGVDWSGGGVVWKPEISRKQTQQR
jgi:hypothetical protein